MLARVFQTPACHLCLETWLRGHLDAGDLDLGFGTFGRHRHSPEFLVPTKAKQGDPEPEVVSKDRVRECVCLSLSLRTNDPEVSGPSAFSSRGYFLEVEPQLFRPVLRTVTQRNVLDSSNWNLDLSVSRSARMAERSAEVLRLVGTNGTSNLE